MKPSSAAAFLGGLAIVNVSTAFAHPAAWHGALGWLVAAGIAVAAVRFAREVERLRGLILRTAGVTTMVPRR